VDFLLSYQCLYNSPSSREKWRRKNKIHTRQCQLRPCARGCCILLGQAGAKCASKEESSLLLAVQHDSFWSEIGNPTFCALWSLSFGMPERKTDRSENWAQQALRTQHPDKPHMICQHAGDTSPDRDPWPQVASANASQHPTSRYDK